MRNEFEKLPFIENLINRKGVEFGKYYGKDIYLQGGEPFEYLNGAWWMYQKMHKSIGFVSGCVVDSNMCSKSIKRVIKLNSGEHAIIPDGLLNNSDLNESHSFKVDDYWLE